MYDNIALLIIAEASASFPLSDLNFAGPEGELVTVNDDKYRDLEILELVLDGMTFNVTSYTPDETASRFEGMELSSLFCDSLGKWGPSFAIEPGDNLKGGRAITAVNRALLKLGKIIGQNVGAEMAVWLPARQRIGFEYFAEVTNQYWDGGLLPVLAQVAIDQKDDNRFETTGLDYFAGQEIYLDAPSTYPPNEVVKRLLRIAHDIAVNGKIDTAAETDGMIEGEKIIFQPSGSLKTVHVDVRAPEGARTH